MKHVNIDYKAAEGEIPSVELIKVYDTASEANAEPAPEAGVLRLQASAQMALESLGPPILAAVADYLGMPTDNATADAIWAELTKEDAPEAAPEPPTHAGETVTFPAQQAEKSKKSKAKKASKKSAPKELQSSANDATSVPSGDNAGNSSSKGTTPGKQDTEMAKSKAKSKSKAKAKSRGKSTPRKAGSGEVRKGSKTEMVKNLLMRKNGTTRKEILEKCEWPAISVQAIAKSCGLKLTKEKEPGKPTVYRGTPLKAAA